MLIAARALLGLAGATLAPSTLSLIRTLFDDPRQRTFAVGVWATSYSVGAAIGPLAGGVVLEFAWWGSVFLLGVPVMALTLLLGPRLLPEHREGRDRPARRAERRAVAGGGAGGRSTGSSSSPSAGRCRSLWVARGRGRRRAVRSPAAAPGGPADRPLAVPRAGVQRRAGDEPGRVLRDLRHGAVHRAVRAVRARLLAADRRAADRVRGARLRGRARCSPRALPPASRARAAVGRDGRRRARLLDRRASRTR